MAASISYRYGVTVDAPAEVQHRGRQVNQIMALVPATGESQLSQRVQVFLDQGSSYIFGGSVNNVQFSPLGDAHGPALTDLAGPLFPDTVYRPQEAHLANLATNRQRLLAAIGTSNRPEAVFNNNLMGMLVNLVGVSRAQFGARIADLKAHNYRVSVNTLVTIVLNVPRVIEDPEGRRTFPAQFFTFTAVVPDDQYDSYSHVSDQFKDAIITALSQTLTNYGEDDGFQGLALNEARVLRVHFSSFYHTNPRPLDRLTQPTDQNLCPNAYVFGTNGLILPLRRFLQQP